jgi:hypothetical protein
MWAFIHQVHPDNHRPKALRHSGIRVGEIIGYRAWRVAEFLIKGREQFQVGGHFT